MCLFCDIVDGKIPSYKIYEDDYTYSFLDISNDANGHILVIPKKHFQNILDCDSIYLSHIMETIKLIGKHLTEKCGFSGINVLNASGKEAEQTVFHLHFHIIPRKANDNMNVFPTLSKNEKDIEEYHKILRISQ